MPLYVAPAAEARTMAQRNRFSRWHRKDAAPNEPGGEFAFQRLQQPFFTPCVSPAFKVQSGDKLFAIGSCFARGIEGALLARKMVVLSAAPEFDSFQTIGPQVTRLGFTNKYNTFSIRNELQWALNPAARFPDESIVDLGKGLY